MQLVILPLLLIGFPVIFAIGVYNSLATLKVRIKEAWSQIDVQLKRRVDLIPNLVETVKAYASHEKQVFESVTQARAQLMGAKDAKSAGVADAALSGALKSLFAVAEAYPDLKAQDGFVNLQKELSDTEDKVAYARQFFNTVVRDFNSKIVTFPSNFVAGMFGFKEETFFEAEEKAKEPVNVKF